MAHGLENVPHEEGRQDHGQKVSSTEFLEGNKKKKRKTVTGDNLHKLLVTSGLS